MNTQIKPGDTVRLRSGGPDLTVKEIVADTSGRAIASCGWFIDNTSQEAQIPCAALDLVSSAPRGQVCGLVYFSDAVHIKLIEIADRRAGHDVSDVPRKYVTLLEGIYKANANLGSD